MSIRLQHPHPQVAVPDGRFSASASSAVTATRSTAADFTMASAVATPAMTTLVVNIASEGLIDSPRSGEFRSG